MMNPIVLRVTDEMKEAFELEARRQKQSIAEVLRRALNTYLKEKNSPKDGIQVLLEWSKKNKFYRANAHLDKKISTNYKKYLYK